MVGQFSPSHSKTQSPTAAVYLAGAIEHQPFCIYLRRNTSPRHIPDSRLPIQKFRSPFQQTLRDFRFQMPLRNFRYPLVHFNSDSRCPSPFATSDSIFTSRHIVLSSTYVHVSEEVVHAHEVQQFLRTIVYPMIPVNTRIIVKVAVFELDYFHLQQHIPTIITKLDARVKGKGNGNEQTYDIASRVRQHDPGVRTNTVLLRIRRFHIEIQQNREKKLKLASFCMEHAICFFNSTVRQKRNNKSSEIDKRKGQQIWKEKRDCEMN
ncbi:hypothetical protein LXL04_001603 [Taraxacum kok-saghyz]